MNEMIKQEKLDFRASGLALDSSATIYLLKSKLLLKLEDPPIPPKPEVDLPPPLIYPLRYELTTTTIKHLLEALKETLKGKKRPSKLRPQLESILPPPLPEILPIDLYLIEIEKDMSELHRRLLHFVDEGKLIIFSKIIAGLEKIEIIKTFITLLFLAQKGEIVLWQKEEMSEIYITLTGGSIIVENETEIT
ncbi:hypothetical protein KAS14_01420 [Candidatus Bathyarchaeota archaeon]|nr:hypothetical protein [Candidatus Bathyarchaeota archaeon]